MKGPRGRWKHDVKRVWECPHCKRRTLTTGAVVHKQCGCITSSEAPMWMNLIEPAKTVRVKPVDDPSSQPAADSEV